MYDILPFPNINGKDAEEQISQLCNYLIQFKETLEFLLTNISVDNLSQELIDKLDTLDSDVEKSNEERDEQITQIANKSLTVSDVINSNLFDLALKEEVETNFKNVKFSVNFETGHLEYTTS